MSAYANGQWNTADLAVIPGGTALGGDALVRADLLPSVIALQAAYRKRWGVALRPTSAGDGYRSLAAQIRVFTQRYKATAIGSGPYGDVRTWRGTRYVRLTGAPAAVPGTSNHGYAQAIDWNGITPDRWAWLMDAAPLFGWTNPAWARRATGREPWHWEGVVVPVSNYHAVPGVGTITIPTVGGTLPGNLTPEDDMSDAQVKAITDRLDAITKTLANQVGPDTAASVARLAELKDWVGNVGDRVDATRADVSTTADVARSNAVRLDILTAALDALATSRGVNPADIRADVQAALNGMTVTLDTNGA